MQCVKSPAVIIHSCYYYIAINTAWDIGLNCYIIIIYNINSHF